MAISAEADAAQTLDNIQRLKLCICQSLAKRIGDLKASAAEPPPSQDAGDRDLIQLEQPSARNVVADDALNNFALIWNLTDAMPADSMSWHLDKNTVYTAFLELDRASDHQLSGEKRQHGQATWAREQSKKLRALWRYFEKLMTTSWSSDRRLLRLKAHYLEIRGASSHQHLLQRSPLGLRQVPVVEQRHQRRLSATPGSISPISAHSTSAQKQPKQKGRGMQPAVLAYHKGE